MNLFWSLFIAAMTLGTLAGTVWLLLASSKDLPPETDEHAVRQTFDGIGEDNHPLPRWWLWLFLATIVFALGYLLLFPGLGSWRGLWPGYENLDPRDASATQPFADQQSGWTSAHAWEREVEQARRNYAPLYTRYAAQPVEQIALDPQALQLGARLFANNCTQCHGADAKGVPGYPNLTDEHWRWGGTPQAIEASIGQGRQAVMPAWSGVLDAPNLAATAAYVVQLTGQPSAEYSAADLQTGQKNYATYCSACHGPTGQGLAALGAPDLTQSANYLYGSDFAAVQQTLREGRQGVMPAQEPWLGSDKVHVLAAYIYHLSNAEPAQP